MGLKPQRARAVPQRKSPATCGALHRIDPERLLLRVLLARLIALATLLSALTWLLGLLAWGLILTTLLATLVALLVLLAALVVLILISHCTLLGFYPPAEVTAVLRTTFPAVSSKIKRAVLCLTAGLEA